MVILRLAKVAIVAMLAAYALLVAYNNIVDYGSNYQFVRHVLSMDTTFPGNALMHRAIADETVWRLAYAAIIATEWATGVLLAIGALALLARVRAPAQAFNRAKVWAVAGLLLGSACGFSASWWSPANTSSCGSPRRGTARTRPFASPPKCSAG
jgi:predicted small integral membrane protein